MGNKGTMIVLLMIVSTTAQADRGRGSQAKAKSAAKAHMEKAARASTEGRFADAIKSLEAAYASDPQPMLLLALGHAHVKNGDCKQAIERYEQYLATNPKQELAGSANEAIESCKATLAPPPPPAEKPKTVVTSEEINADDENPTLAGAPRPAPRVVDDAPPAARQVDAPGRRSPFKDPILIGLGVGGIAGIAAGVVLYSSARGKLDDSEGAATYDESTALVDDARNLRTYSIVAGVAGAALVGGAVFYYLRKHGDDEEPRLTVVPTPRGGIVGWAGRF